MESIQLGMEGANRAKFLTRRLHEDIIWLNRSEFTYPDKPFLDFALAELQLKRD